MKFIKNVFILHLLSGVARQKMKMEAEDGRADDDGGGFFSLDYGAWDVRVAVIGGGFALYSCVFLLTHLVSQALSVTYNSLHSQERAFWSLAATRAVFGVKATFAGGGNLLKTFIDEHGLLLTARKKFNIHTLLVCL